MRDSDKIRSAAQMIKRGDVFDNLDRARHPRYLPDVYEEVANLRDRLDAYGQIIQRLNSKIERLENAKAPR